MRVVARNAIPRAPDPTRAAPPQDNTSTLILANSGHLNSRTKHIAIRYLYCNELIKEGVVALKYLRTSEMSADVLTKALYSEDHRRHVNVLMGYSDTALDG